MSPEAQRIAIAEACGWTPDLPGECDLWKHPKLGDSYTLDDLPDYLNDLNAMHEAEKILTQDRAEQYANTLYRLPAFDSLKDTYDDIQFDAVFKLIHAISAQRAEAFLRTIGKWDDSK